MKRLGIVGIITLAPVILGACLPLFNAEACTRMFWNTNGKAMLVGRNMDLDMDDQPVFYVFPRGISRDGGLIDDNKSATWTSQYGSIVVTALGHSDFSTEGVNEAGLAFHYLWLTPTQFEERDRGENRRAGVLEGRYGIYLLDNAATVGKALKLMHGTQLVQEDIAGKKFPLHIAMEDASGDSAVVEFVEDPITHKGHMHVYHGAKYNVLTNDPPFDQHFPNLSNYQYFGGDLPLPGDCNPSARFVRASAFLTTLNLSVINPAVKPDHVSAMFHAIRSMSEPFGAFQFFQGVPAPIPAWPTLWTLVYNLTNKRIYFSHNMARNNFWINMRKLSFTEGAPILMLDAKRPGLAGEVSKLLKPPQ
jgi:penicillin V acylase-like amidase (Ntn superfamily)